MPSIAGEADEVARVPSPTIFVSDPSAEAERIAQALRATGYVVVDVPMSMLFARVAVQRPRVVLIDADTEGALESVERLRELPDAEGVDIVFLGKIGVTLAGKEDALAHEGSGFFERPVDVPALVRKVEALTGGPKYDASHARTSTPPPSLPESRMPAGGSPDRTATRPFERGSLASAAPMSPSLRAAFEANQPGSSPPPTRRPFSIQTPLSSELEALLAEAEQRVSDQLAVRTALPTPEEEIEAVLPAEILSSLDEPIDDDDGRASESSERPGAFRPTTHAGEGGQSETHGGQSATTTGNRATSSAAGTHLRTEKRAAISVASTPESPEDTPATEYESAAASHGLAERATRGSLLQADTMALRVSVSPRASTDNDHARDFRTSPLPDGPGSPRVASRVMLSTVLGEWEAPVVLARAIAARTTGTLCFESTDGVRRAVLREGDLVTAASGVDSESLLAFLGARGDLPREQLQQMDRKLPAFGRHAGAALVAHGHLRQDQLWPVLRAHAEWILGKVIVLRSGTAHIEAEPPGRLRNEPSVFGGSTGAEVIVEVVRRGVAPEEASVRLGGPSGRIGDGDHAALLSECALDGAERELLAKMKGATLGELAETAPGADLVSVVYALSLLGVIDVIRGTSSGRGAAAADAAEIDALDEDAIRARVRARLEIVDEGDYFAVLGVAHDATGYEVKRAFLELRRSFEPSRILTPRVADLKEELRKITGVLEEAYEILRDAARRERYRRAIFAIPKE